MSERKHELLIEADVLSSRLFDMLVESALQGRDEGIVIEWVDDGREFAGGIAQKPIVTLSGEPAPQFVRRHLESGASSSDELIDVTSELFQGKMGDKWEDTVDMYEGLDMAIGTLAYSSAAGYWDRAVRTMHLQGVDNAGDGEIMAAARLLVMDDLKALSETDQTV